MILKVVKLVSRAGFGLGHHISTTQVIDCAFAQIAQIALTGTSGVRIAYAAVARG